MPTLLEARKIAAVDPAIQERIDQEYPVAIEYTMDWFKKAQELTGIENRVLVFKSDTGSGKSTVFPPFLYNRFYKKGQGDIIVTQPRVLTAQTIPQDIVAYNENLKLGVNIGWQTGNSKNVPNYGILFATIGVLSMQLGSMEDTDFMKKYRFIVIDECHELSVELCMALYALKSFMLRNKDRPELPFLILTSATFDTSKYLDYFGVNRPHVRNFIGDLQPNLIRVIGFSQPKYDHYPFTLPVKDYIHAGIELIKKIHLDGLEDPEEKGDILMFLPGRSEVFDKLIEELNESLVKDGHPPFIYLLVDRREVLAGSDQILNINRPLKSLRVQVGGKSRAPFRRVVAATSVAETGLTIKSLYYVIDNGYSNSSEFYPIVNGSGVMLKPAPKSSIEQRRGRVGRVFPGHAYYLYPKDVHDQLQENRYSDLVTSDVSMHFLQLVKIQETMNGHFKPELIDLIDPIPGDSIVNCMEKCLALGFIERIAGDESIFKLTRMGTLANQIPLVSLEHRRLLLAAGFWNVSTLDLINICAFANEAFNSFRENPKKEIKWESIYETALTFDIFKKSTNIVGLEVRLKMLMCDELIDGIFLVESMMQVLAASKGSKFMSKITMFLEDANLNLEKMSTGIEYRDDLIEALLNIHINPFDGRRRLIESESIDEFMKILVSLKYCIYDAFRCNLAFWSNEEKTYKYSGISVKTVHWITDKVVQSAKKGGIEIDMTARPHHILFNKLDIKFKQNVNEYQASASKVSVPDGFIFIDPDFIYNSLE
jgi:hypothetical protein